MLEQGCALHFHAQVADCHRCALVAIMHWSTCDLARSQRPKPAAVRLQFEVIAERACRALGIEPPKITQPDPMRAALEAAYADYCEGVDPDDLPPPWVEEAQRLLGEDRCNAIFAKANTHDGMSSVSGGEG